MNAPIPHYLLFSESQPNPGSANRPPSSDGSGRWRIVLESIDGSSKLEASDEEEGSAERLELLAVIRGLEAIPQPAKVTLVTPSRYVNRGLRFGLTEWRENGWQWERFGEMSTVSNADLWQRLDRALAIHKVQCRSWRFDPPHAEHQSSSLGRGERRTARREVAPSNGALDRLRMWWSRSWQTPTLRAS